MVGSAEGRQTDVEFFLSVIDEHKTVATDMNW